MNMKQRKRTRSDPPDNRLRSANRPHFLPADQRARILEQLASELETERDIAFAFLYGSFLESDGFHDVDVGVYLRSTERASILALDLAQRLSARVGVPVDVRILNDVPISFLYHVLRGHLILSRDEDLLGEVMERTVGRYLDIAPLLRHSTKEAFAR
jgi:predicted nucleotidyltransferase